MLHNYFKSTYLKEIPHAFSDELVPVISKTEGYDKQIDESVYFEDFKKVEKIIIKYNILRLLENENICQFDKLIVVKVIINEFFLNTTSSYVMNFKNGGFYDDWGCHF